SGVNSGGLDLSLLSTAGMNLGSLEGSGITSLGSKTLTLGGNNFSTTYSGLIRDGGYSGASGGTLTKVGTGTFTLAGAATFTGGAVVNGGTLATIGFSLPAPAAGAHAVINTGGTYALVDAPTTHAGAIAITSDAF